MWNSVRSSWPLVGAVVLAASVSVLAQNPAGDRIRQAAYDAWGAPTDPFRIVGNVYYVGASNIGSYLVTTTEGHVLVDTGTTEMWPRIARNVGQLGFRLADVRFIVTGHAHFDHVQGHAPLKRVTGARVAAMEPDVAALQSGRDTSPLDGDGWEPVVVDRVLRDGDTLVLGETQIRAIGAPGHSPGCGTYVTDVREEERAYRVAFASCGAPVPGVPVLSHSRFPNLATETLASYRKLRDIPIDIYLPGHPQAHFGDRLAAIKAGVRPHPLANPSEWQRMLVDGETAFVARMEQERSNQSR